jgi:hypothetical protein
MDAFAIDDAAGALRGAPTAGPCLVCHILFGAAGVRGGVLGRLDGITCWTAMPEGRIGLTLGPRFLRRTAGVTEFLAAALLAVLLFHWDPQFMPTTFGAESKA